MGGYAAIVLAGGAGRRLGGPGKPALSVGGVAMLTRVLSAVADAVPRVVVGPATLTGLLPEGVRLTREKPPGTGPAAATAAGLRLVPDDAEQIALLAGDLPFLTARAVAALRHASSTLDGALFVDRAGRRQLLCGVWRAAALRANLAALGEPAGQSIRRLLDGLPAAEVRWTESGPSPWYDCDTEAELRSARDWADRVANGDGGAVERPDEEET